MVIKNLITKDAPATNIDSPGTAETEINLSKKLPTAKALN